MGSKQWMGKAMSKGDAAKPETKPAKPGKRAALIEKMAAMRKK